MAVGRYVVVNPATQLIVGGPYLWDPENEWTPPEITNDPDAGYEVMEESAALGAGFTYPEA